MNLNFLNFNTSPIQQRGNNVGIGTNNPLYTLDVNGSARVNGVIGSNMGSYPCPIGISSYTINVFSPATYLVSVSSSDTQMNIKSPRCNQSVYPFALIHVIFNPDNTIFNDLINSNGVKITSSLSDIIVTIGDKDSNVSVAGNVTINLIRLS